MENILSGIPIWVSEFFVGAGISILIALVYGLTLYFLRENAVAFKNLKKWADIVVALYAWFALLYQKVQQGAQDAQISLNTSLLFYAAIAFAVITIVHAMIEPNNREIRN